MHVQVRPRPLFVREEHYLQKLMEIMSVAAQIIIFIQNKMLETLMPSVVFVADHVRFIDF